MNSVRAHVHVAGWVQGVGFRYASYCEARRQGVVGWVRNLTDGRVEAIFEGNRDAVERMVRWCRHGPPGASVEGVDVDWQAATGEFVEFGIGAPGRR